MTQAIRLPYFQLAPKAFQQLYNLSGAIRKDLLGARLVEAFPVVQVAGNVPLSVAALSYAGQLNIGIQSDPDGLPDLDLFTDGLRQSLESNP